MTLRADLRRRGIGLHVIEQGIGTSTVESRGRLRHAVRARRTSARAGNARGLGACCASYCRLTTAHHEREDLDLVPCLRRSEPQLGPVFDRLEKHHAIHGVIEWIDQALGTRVIGEDGDDGAAFGHRSAHRCAGPASGGRGA
ncbi:hypothetical protein [Streptomyces sp. NPDC057580]|uniref:hypothetical protein n=1 Tax=Streptomyces sp. NPDC057580 TaxID=3346173 RepID=UPI00369E3AFB